MANATTPDPEGIIREAKRLIRRRPLMEVETVRRLLESRNDKTRYIAEAAVDFCVFNEQPQSPSWPKSPTWAKIIAANRELNQHKG
jgi:hypothetical protein